MKESRPDLTFITQARVMDEKKGSCVFSTTKNIEFSLQESKEIKGLIKAIPTLLQYVEAYHDSLPKGSFLQELVRKTLNEIKTPYTQSNLFRLRLQGSNTMYVLDISNTAVCADFFAEKSHSQVDTVEQYSYIEDKFVLFNVDEFLSLISIFL